MSVFDPPTVLKILKLSHFGAQAQQKRKSVNTWLGSRSGDTQLTKQFTWESQVVEYVNFVYKSTTEHSNKKNGFGPPPLPKGIPILGPRVPPKLSIPELYIRPLNIIHPFYYDIARCPQCNSTDVKWDSWTGAGSREIHGLCFKEKAFGFQLRCALCKAKFGKDGTRVGAKNADGEKFVFSFATTNTVFWAGWEHWKIPRVTRELFNFIIELQPSTTAGGLEENIKQFHLLEYKRRHLAYLNTYNSHSFQTALELFLAPNDRLGYNDKSISNDMISDIFRDFTKQTREPECSKYLCTLSVICMNLDNTFKAAKKATVANSSKARTQLMNGGILSVLNEQNEIIAWRFGQTGAAAEMVELLEGLKTRFELLGVPAPEMVTIDNCCTYANKIHTVFEAIKVLDNSRGAEVLKDIRDAIIKERATKDTFAQYWPHSEQVVRLVAAYDKRAERGAWSAAAANIHTTQLEHVRKGCLARPCQDIASNGSQIEGSHKGWNSLQRSFASGLETQTSLGHDFVLRRNIRTALNGKYKSSKPFIKLTFGSHHIALVDYTAAVWNDLVATKGGSSLNPLPRLDNIASSETFGVVNSENTETFGEEDEDDEMVTIEPEEQDQLIKELNLDPSLFTRPLSGPAAENMFVAGSSATTLLIQIESSSRVANTSSTVHTATDANTTPHKPLTGVKGKDPPPPSLLEHDPSPHAPQTKIRKLNATEQRPIRDAYAVDIHLFFAGTIAQAKTLTNNTTSAAPKLSPELIPSTHTSLAQLNAPLPLPAASGSSQKLAHSQQFFATSTGTNPHMLSIQYGPEWMLFMRMRSQLQWRVVDMSPKKWVAAATAFNNELKTLQASSNQSLIAKNPRALVTKLGNVEAKIVQRISDKDFTSKSGKTLFWTEHCFAVPFIKTETGSYFPHPILL
ncbi:hypothetical protein R3P38DRAFT_3224861 [Favolaschia claudopus]|uniref:Transposase n=1 Tax=Favolaschia claudopus TaxID=2862362 RepID=A0AAV9ZVD5_9AGAR